MRSLYKPSELHAFLKEMGAAPKKSLSQNFLIDGNIVRKIIAFADIQEGDTVLEIGPGPGVLTEALLARGAHVIAVEKDKKFSQALQKWSHPHLTVIEGDILTSDIPLKPNMKLVANLPYQITTPILARFLPLRQFFQSITVMVQKEVATRFLALPVPIGGSKDYGSLAVFIRFYSDPVYGFTVKPSCFYPRPKIHSAVVQLIPKSTPKVPEKEFFEMTRLAFQHRRKMIRSSLKTVYDQPSIDLALGQRLYARPEELSLDEFVSLFQKIIKRKSNSTE